MTNPRKPYKRECDRCGSHDIRMMSDGPQKVKYEYCGDCKHRYDGLGGFLIGPGIRGVMSSKRRMEIYDRYFGDCCTACGEEKGLKVCGYTEDGRGIPFRLCPTCRHPIHVQISKITFDVAKMDEDWFNRVEIEKKRQEDIAQKKMNIRKMGVKQPDMNRRTGKTQRNRERKAGRKA